MSRPLIAGCRSLVAKLSSLEALLSRANESKSLQDLAHLLKRLEEIVTCSHCHQAYLERRSETGFQDQIVRVQTEVYRSFGLIEKELGRRQPERGSLTRYLSAVSRAALKEAEFLKLDHRSKLLFIGCGARPVSSHALCASFGCQVVGVDLDPECVEGARRYARCLAQSSRLSFILGDGAEIDLTGFSHVIVASLVENKAGVLRNLASGAPPEVRVALRFGEGLHRLMNYPLPEAPIANWRSFSLDPNPRGLYQTLYLSGSPG